MAQWQYLSRRQASIRSHHPHSIREEDEEREGEWEVEEEEEDVLPQMETSGKQGLVDERLRALLMLLNQVCRCIQINQR